MKKKRSVFARAPSRIDFAGGTLDLPFFAEKEKGSTLNCAVKKYGYASIKSHIYEILTSVNYTKTIKISKPLNYNKNLDLLKAGIKLTDFFEKAAITTNHEMPPHSRLGTSSSILVSLLGAILRFQKKQINKEKIAKLASFIESTELGLNNGPQDQYAASFGGFNLLKFNGKKVTLKHLKLKENVVYELEKNLLLCHLGSSHVSSNLNFETIQKYEQGDKRLSL
jgi:D-glycero-alpha-D-manno-heptose-7-phosphate kinase